MSSAVAFGVEEQVSLFVLLNELRGCLQRSPSGLKSRVSLLFQPQRRLHPAQLRRRGYAANSWRLRSCNSCERSLKGEPFYREVPVLKSGFETKANWLSCGPEAMQEWWCFRKTRRVALQHFAFTLDEADIEGAAAMLRGRGVEVQGPVFLSGCPRRHSTSEIRTDTTSSSWRL